MRGDVYGETYALGRGVLEWVWNGLDVEIRNRACGFAGYKCSKSTATYVMLLILLSKIATRNHMTKIKATMPGNAVSDRLSTVSPHTPSSERRSKQNLKE